MVKPLESGYVISCGMYIERMRRRKAVMIEKPSKLFPCDCMGEGLTVTPLSDNEDISEGEVLVSEDKVLRDYKEAPFIQISFWDYGSCSSPKYFSYLWWRLRTAWHVFRDGSAWPDQVIMKAKVARNLANHILYIINKASREIEREKKQEPLVKEEPHAMFCFQHGGSDACEKSNKKYGFDCPKCLQLADLGIDEEGKPLLDDLKRPVIPVEDPLE